MDILIPTSPISPEKKAEIESGVNKFVAVWNSNETLKEIGSPNGKGVSEDIYCLDYVIYEELFSLFVTNATEFIDLGVAILGNVLVNLLDFEWCSIVNGSSNVIALQNSFNNMRVPIRELIIYRLSAYPQFDSYEHLFFDILLSSNDWQKGYHPLLECNLESWVDNFDFREIYGYDIPGDIKKEIELFLYQDRDLFVRKIGFDAYDLPSERNWEKLKYRLFEITNLFNKIFGKDWKGRCLDAM